MERNGSAASKEAIIRTIAAMDWGNIPTVRIADKLSTSPSMINHYRATDTYKECIATLRAEWDAAMKRLPHTEQLKKSIRHGMVLGVNKLIEILAGDFPAKDQISAARLVAQMDGQFLKPSDSDSEHPNRGAESVAQELIEAMRRQRGTIQ